MVASVIGAPLNGVGLVGIYPRAVLRSWDVAQGAGHASSTRREISGGILAAARAGKGVINLSVGGDTRDLAIELAVSEAVASGSLVVAPSGNDGDRGNPIGYPAAFPHVTTVAATDRSGAVAAFSSRSPYVDIAAPGDDIVVASALGKNWRPAPARASRPRSSPALRPGSGRSAPSSPPARWRDPAPLRARHRRAGTRLRLGLRDAQRRAPRSRSPRRSATPSSRTTTSTRSTRTATATSQGAAADDVVASDRARSRGASTRTRTRATSSASGCRRGRSVTATLTASADGRPRALHRRRAHRQRPLRDHRSTRERRDDGHRPSACAFRNTGRGRWAYVVVKLPGGTLDATYNLTLAAPRTPAR